MFPTIIAAFHRQVRLALFAGLTLVACATTPAAEVVIRSNDVVAFLGGADVAAAQHTGHLESLMAVLAPGARFRNLGWEGDTVFTQPRDVGFPSVSNSLARVDATTVVFQFGRTEAMDGTERLDDFAEAYGKLLDDVTTPEQRVILVTPPPFESGPGPATRLEERNRDLSEYVERIRKLARSRNAGLFDLFAELSQRTGETGRLTDNGLQITPSGQALIASLFARRLEPNLQVTWNADGDWTNPSLEKVRRAVIEKNHLWFNYWRPQNWAFLGGDRISQPSSRDHRDPKIRWFPAEVERFVPLIAAKESEVAQLATSARPALRK